MICTPCWLQKFFICVASYSLKLRQLTGHLFTILFARNGRCWDKESAEEYKAERWTHCVVWIRKDQVWSQWMCRRISTFRRSFRLLIGLSRDPDPEPHNFGYYATGIPGALCRAAPPTRGFRVYFRVSLPIPFFQSYNLIVSANLKLCITSPFGQWCVWSGHFGTSWDNLGQFRKTFLWVGSLYTVFPVISAHFLP